MLFLIILFLFGHISDKDIVFSKIIQLMDAIGFKFYKKYNNCIKL